MAKKKGKPKPVRGIYKRRGEGRNRIPADSPEAEEAMRAWGDEINKPIEEWLDDLTDKIAGRLRQWLVAPDYGRGVFSIDFGDGPAAYSFDAENSVEQNEALQDSVDALSKIRVIRSNLCAGGNRDFAMREMFGLGRCVERIQVRPFEPLVDSGRKTKERAIKGGKSSAKLTGAQKTLAKKIIADEKKRAGVSRKAACDRAAALLKSEHGIEISGETLRKQTW